MVLFSIVLSFFCVLIFYCFNKRISVSPKPGMVYHTDRPLAEQIFASSLTLSNFSIIFFREVIFDRRSKTPLGF